MGSEAPTQVRMLTKQVLYWLGCLPQPTGHWLGWPPQTLKTLAEMSSSAHEDTDWGGYWLGPGIASPSGLSLHALFPSLLALSANTGASTEQISVWSPGGVQCWIKAQTSAIFIY